MYTNGTTLIDMYEHTFIPQVFIFFISLLIYFLSPFFLHRNEKKKNKITKKDERNLGTEQMGPDVKGEICYSIY